MTSTTPEERIVTPLHIGQIVHWRPPVVTGTTEDHGDFHAAAIVTMTHEEWTASAKQYGKDVPTAVPQPDEGHVHLYVFPIADANPADIAAVAKESVQSAQVANYPVGTGPGTCSPLPHGGYKP